MLTEIIKKNIVLLGATSISLGVAYAYGDKITKWMWCYKTRQLSKKQRDVVVVSNPTEWNEVYNRLISESSSIGAVGFDCEWVTVKASRKPVALLQLATHRGLCVLVRLCEFKSDIPESLKDFLKNEEVLKCGVSCLDDKQYLFNDYNIEVNGCLDLRHLAIQVQTKGSHSDLRGLGLRALAAVFLNKKLDKNWKIRRGNWEAAALNKEQILYAADDALVGVQILLVLLGYVIHDSKLSMSYSLGWHWWENLTLKLIENEAGYFKDRKFSYPKKGAANATANMTYIEKKKAAIANLSQPKVRSKGYTTRKGPLYHNTLLWAPDNQPLCTLDPRKAQWYIDKDLGEKVSDDPFIVRLKFEPCGRPQLEGGDGFFYLQDRFNICVVCGKDNSHFRKSVIPHEYRKHFPQIMKSHQSHDVLLLCVDCHLRSNQYDNILRCQLAEECRAPIGQENDIKVKMNTPLKAVRSAGGALLKSRRKMPANRIASLEKIIKEHYEVDEITEELIQEASNIDLQIVNKDYFSHSAGVYNVYKKTGLIKFELKWRQYFLDTMKPKFLPTGWSVHHNHKKLELKMSRLPLDHPEREDYRIALVGTEGFIDVPYIPRSKETESNNNNNNDNTDNDTNSILDENIDSENTKNTGDNFKEDDSVTNLTVDIIEEFKEEDFINKDSDDDDDYDIIIESEE